MTPQEMINLQNSFATLMMDTYAVVSLRIMGMVGAIPSQTNENTRMLNEKAPAFAEAMTALTNAALSGYRADQIMAAGIAPLQREVSNNRARLTR